MFNKNYINSITILDILWHKLNDALLTLEETIELAIPPLDLG